MSGISRSSSAVWLALRSLLWTLLLPGFFAGWVPWRYFALNRVTFDPSSAAHVIGVVSVGVGALLLAGCIYEFARSGRGTLSPLDPPHHLVVRGLYRYVRNPMYLSVTMIVLGEVLLTRSTALAMYWVVWFISANLFVMGYEEPTLRHEFGAEYQRVLPAGRAMGSQAAVLGSITCSSCARPAHRGLEQCPPLTGHTLPAVLPS